MLERQSTVQQLKKIRDLERYDAEKG